MRTKVKKGDKVKIISGKDRGKVALVLRVFAKESKVLVQGVNVVKKHVKPGKVSKEGGVISIEKPISLSNVMYFNDKINSPVKVGFRITGGKKYRFCKKTDEILDK